MRDRNPDEIHHDADEWLRDTLDRIEREYNERELRDVLINIATTRIIEGAQT